MNVVQAATVRGLVLAALLLGATPAIASESETMPFVQLRIDGIRPNYAILPEGFPAISQDHSKIAVYRSDDAMSYSAFVDVVRTVDGRWLRRFVLLSEQEGEAGLEEIGDRVAARPRPLNAFLAAGKFAPLPLLYEMTFPMNRNLLPEEHFTNAGREIVYERKTKTLTIYSLRTGRGELWMRRPVLDNYSPFVDPDDQCPGLQGTPVKGWIDESTRTVVFQIEYVGTRDSCDQPEEWAIRHLRR